MNAAKIPPIVMTEAAEAHFHYLIEKEEMPGMGLRIFVERGGHPKAEVNIAFCPPGEQRAGDIPMAFPHFVLFVAQQSAPYLREAEIDYKKEGMNGQLVVSAPYLRGEQPTEGAPLSERVTYLLETEINPMLAHHGGRVHLVEVTDDNSVVLRFGGGCHGCGMVDVTLKQGIEKTLKDALPEIHNVVDITDHSRGENPYY